MVSLPGFDTSRVRQLLSASFREPSLTASAAPATPVVMGSHFHLMEKLALYRFTFSRARILAVTQSGPSSTLLAGSLVKRR